MQATQALDAIDHLESRIIRMYAELYTFVDPDEYNRQLRYITVLESELSDLRNLGRNDSEPDVTIDYDDYSQVIRDTNDTDVWERGAYGHVNLTLTNRQHRKSLNIWTDARGYLMVGRMRISFSANGRPTATCSHCGLAFTAVSNTIVTAECFTLAVIAHGHNDGPAFARAYQIAERTYYRPITRNHSSLAQIILANAYARALQALTPVVVEHETLGAIVDNGQLARLLK